MVREVVEADLMRTRPPLNVQMEVSGRGPNSLVLKNDLCQSGASLSLVPYRHHPLTSIVSHSGDLSEPLLSPIAACQTASASVIQ